MLPVADLIVYDGNDSNSTFVWKFPQENFNTLSQLIVHESQEAIFFMNGQALDLFGPGHYTLETQNIPLVGNALRRAITRKNPFHCEVYFINKAVQMNIKWGTDRKVRILDPLTQVPLEIGAYGEMNLQVIDSRKFLVKLIGTTTGIAWDDRKQFVSSLQNAFRPHISTAVKANLANAIKTKNLDLFELDVHLEELSEALRMGVSVGFEEYGLHVPQLYVNSISLPDNDANFAKLRDLHSFKLQKLYAVAQVEKDIDIEVAERELMLEKETTTADILEKQTQREVFIAKKKSEKAVYDAEVKRTMQMTDVEIKRAEGLAEADIMRAKGYTERDKISAEVEMTWAKGVSDMGGGYTGGTGSPVGGGMGGMGGGNMVDLGIGIAVAEKVSQKVGNMLGNIVDRPEPATVSIHNCPGCGKPLPAKAKYCPECGNRCENSKVDEIPCPDCGKKTRRGKFCMECGAILIRNCAKCEADIPVGAKFCLECGERV